MLEVHTVDGGIYEVEEQVTVKNPRNQAALAAKEGVLAVAVNGRSVFIPPHRIALIELPED